MTTDRLSVRDALGDFAPGQSLRAALFLTYGFDGQWFERSFAPDLYDRPVASSLVIYDRNAVIADAPSVRYDRALAGFSTRVFHPKLTLLVAEDRALAFVGSANLTVSGMERNLECGTMVEISPEGGPKPFFASLLDYLSGPLKREVSGSAASTLAGISLALREVLAHAKGFDSCFQHFLHSSDQPIWNQLLARVPHRQLRRALIVSPFFEPDGGTTTTPSEDPPDPDPEISVFARLMTAFDFTGTDAKKPVSVYFEQDDGRTHLPLELLKRYHDRISLHPRDVASPDSRRLHGKMLILEGSDRGGKKPFLLTLHGSPNFTAAALLSTPPAGNAEIAVLTEFPGMADGAAKAARFLGLDKLFTQVNDWGALRQVLPQNNEPVRDWTESPVLDASLGIARQTLTVHLRPVEGKNFRVRLFAKASGAWVLIGESPWDGRSPLTLTGQSIQTLFDATAGMRRLTSSTLRVEVIHPDGSAAAIGDAPLNVDCPDQFCDLAMTGPILQRLDERIAHAGLGAVPTYREQKDFLQRQRETGAGISSPFDVTTHQGSLDQFFKNVRTGFHGMRYRLQAAKHSEHALRSTLRILSTWTQDALSEESHLPSAECKLFLVDRLLQQIDSVVELTQANSKTERLLPDIAHELGLHEAAANVDAWLQSLEAPDATVFVSQARANAGRLRDRLISMGGQR